MAAILTILYRILVIPLMITGFYIGSAFNAKMREGRKARKNQFLRLSNEISKATDRKRILFHCSSAGEWLQALPIIEKLKATDPRLFIMVSFFSPSGFKFSKTPPEVDLKFYLPLDTFVAARRLFRLLKPDIWVISKFDVWPNHLMAAAKLHIPVVITSATLSANSRRDKGFSRIFNKHIYSKISHFFPISDDDKNRFQLLVPGEEKYTVAGDTRFDHVVNRGNKANEAEDVTIFKDKNEITVIAGSTWPSDEKHILPALVRLCTELPRLQVIIVPHELDESHLSDIENAFLRYGIKSERFTNFSGHGYASVNVVIFNTIGLLARLYKHTDIAFVGGSFGKGTHNVMEPAVFGQPVLFGPHHLNSFEAGELLKINAAYTINNQEEFYEKVSLLIRDGNLRRSMGNKAKDFIKGNTGATTIIINKLKEKYGIIS
jgi:3-deoxy-D-manno-octulosonic-acid transferase